MSNTVLAISLDCYFITKKMINIVHHIYEKNIQMNTYTNERTLTLKYIINKQACIIYSDQTYHKFMYMDEYIKNINK